VPDAPAGDGASPLRVQVALVPGRPLAGAHAGHHGSMESLAGRLERRAFECRLTPDRALQDLPEAEAFLRDRGMLTRTADCALPSLYEACHEDPYKPGSPGFATWPATKWPWFGELAGRALGDLIVAGVRAAVVAPERELRRWFSWQWYWTGALVDGLVRAGRLRRAGGYVTVAG
jgi:hypothetical protein